MPDDREQHVDEDFLARVLFAQTKDVVLTARQREYARFGISIDIRRKRDRLELYLRKRRTRVLHEPGTPEWALVSPCAHGSADA